MSRQYKCPISVDLMRIAGMREELERYNLSDLYDIRRSASPTATEDLNSFRRRWHPEQRNATLVIKQTTEEAERYLQETKAKRF
ncbi:hypothetical protein J4217_04910 [Candidatus Pacearchaeota archaeon]|nr:hypothetical protein [Candidatus Pacearchaeota archaeon]